MTGRRFRPEKANVEFRTEAVMSRANLKKQQRVQVVTLRKSRPDEELFVTAVRSTRLSIVASGISIKQNEMRSREVRLCESYFSSRKPVGAEQLAYSVKLRAQEKSIWYQYQ